tara:strand:- start:685 stop:1302 length:618 start_codon:yes stop_codon:yes gene_type:complete
MKKISSYILFLVLSFNSASSANELKEFEIAGFSLGESLLDYFDKSDIKNELKSEYTYFYKDNKYAVLGVGDGVDYNLSMKFENYDELALTVRPDDKKFIIYSVSGDIFCKDNIKKCLSQQKEIVSELEDFLGSEFESWEKPHSVDPSGKSMVYGNNITYADGSDIAVDVYQWSDKMKQENNFPDTLQVSMSTKEFSNFLMHEAYN